MARPPIEWPIPAYVVELRERVVLTFRVPARHLATLVPAPMTPETVGGQALVSLCLGNGRCLNAVGGVGTLLTEFHTAEVMTPVRYDAPCQAVMRGNMVLGSASDSHGLSRLVRTALGFDAETAPVHAESDGRGRRWLSPGQFGVGLPRALAEAAWPADSLLAGAEEAEAALAHPEYQFFARGDGRAVQAVPVHFYARSTVHVEPTAARAPGLARLLGLDESELRLDHVLFQKRCTHTWSFPPERIPVAPKVHAVRWGMRAAA